LKFSQAVFLFSGIWKYGYEYGNLKFLNSKI